MYFTQCLRLGPQSLFITMTTNPEWEEITRELLPGQVAADRPDLISRVFALKVGELLNELTVRMCFGVAIAHVHVIEFQKRGLPHVHLLQWLREDCKIRTPQHVDSIVSAEIPDPQVNVATVVVVDIKLMQTHPRLHAIVKKCMVHGPCGLAFAHLNPSCTSTPGKPKCDKHYPFDFNEETSMGNRACPVYRRRNTGRTVTVGRGATTAVVDNRFIIPYSPYLTLRFNCHINVEVTTGVKAVKYIFK